jgi:hypothetical protein
MSRPLLVLRTSPLCSLVAVLSCFIAGVLAQRGSFANTKFELGADLPVEEPPPPVVIAENVDSRTVTASSNRAQPLSALTTTPATPATNPSVASPPNPESNRAMPLPTLPPLLTFPPTSPSNGQSFFPTLAAVPSHPPASFTTLPPPITPIVGVRRPPTSVIARPSAASSRSSSRQPQTYLQRPSADSGSQNGVGNQADLWFREDFDLSTCPRRIDSISQALKRKFPSNLLSNGRETVLADLLARQIIDCRKKQRRDHWNSVERYIDSLGDISPTDREECRAGQIQEQISCLNLFSYACQFVQPAYVFRLVPTRIIVQEARLAEDGAEKCRKFTKKLSTTIG